MHFENHAWQRLPRRAAEHGPIDCGKNSPMARACKYVFLRPIKYGARRVGAESAEGQKCAVRRMQQEAGMLVIRVGNDFHAADG